MALVVKDRVQETSTTTGTGSLTLAGAVTGFQTFSSAIGNTNTTYYTIQNGAEWEVGIGTVSASALSRDTVLESSNGGSLVNFSAGTKFVFCTYPAEKSVYYDASNNVNIDITGNAATVTNGLYTTNIGTTVQAYDADTTKNDVANTFTANQVISVTDNTNAALRVTQLGTGNALVVEDSTNPDSTPFVIDANGNVGIGTSSPSNRLHVVGPSGDYRTALFESASTNGPSVQIKGSRIYELRSTNTGAGEGGGLFFIYDKTAEASRITIDSSGNVGIGTSSPTARLNVNGSTTVSSQVNVAAVIGPHVTSDVLIGSVNGNTPFVASQGDYPLTFNTNATERMRVDTSGNVGIGTSSPDTRLTVEGGTGAALRVRSGGDLVLNNAANSGDIYLYCDDAGVLTVNGGLRFNSGYGSAATAYGCRAWVNFNGSGTVAIRASGNVSSITDNGTGQYTVNLSSAMPDANYSVTGGSTDGNDGAGNVIITFFPVVSAGSFKVRTSTEGGTAVDAPTIMCSIHR
jgi:hypothetical protein